MKLIANAEIEVETILVPWSRRLKRLKCAANGKGVRGASQDKSYRSRRKRRRRRRRSTKSEEGKERR